MGKATIKEHLGDAHYKIALTIDVSYAKKALTEHEAYLAELQPKVDAAKDARDVAKGEFTAAGVALEDWIKPRREASEAAYQTMTDAYNAWLSAISSAPDPVTEASNIKSMQDTTQAWLDAEDNMLYVLANDYYVVDPAPLYPPAVALRNTTLLISQAADGSWENSRGEQLDSTAVTTAREAKILAFGNLDLALVEFVEAYIAWYESGGSLPDPQYDAYQIARQNYESKRADWIKTVQDNTGNSVVAARKKEYEATQEAFNKAQEELATLLKDGSMPPGLLEKYQKMQEAEQRWRTADLEHRQLLLMKTERDKQASDLRGRLLNFYDPDGEPIDQLANAWCADATEDLAVGTAVATIEIPGERDLGVRVRPGYEHRYDYSATRDGKLQPSWASSPEATFYNWAIHPGAQKWKPNYRLGIIKAIDAETGKATVELDAQKNGEKSKARDGATLDVNNPVKTKILPGPPNGPGGTERELPGENVTSENGKTTLKNVTIEYMECNSEAFEVDDHVIVEFTGRDWTQPKIIGFAENPRPCNQRGVMCTANVLSQSESVWLQDISKPGATATLKHPLKPKYGGNIDWVSADNKTLLSWQGPLGRSIPPMLRDSWTAAFDGSGFPYDLESDYRQRWVWFYGAPLLVDPDDTDGWTYQWCVPQRFSGALWMNGAKITDLDNGRHILGATLVTCLVENVTYRWLVVVTVNGLKLGHGSGSVMSAATAALDISAYPECVDHAFHYAALPPSGAVPASAWTLFHTATLSSDPALSAPTGAYFFSGNGLKFATLVPTVAAQDAMRNGANGGFGNSAIIRGTLLPTADGVTIGEFAITPQPHGGTVSHSGSANAVEFEGYADWTSDGTWSHVENTNHQAIIAIDFINNNEVTLVADYAYNSAQTYSWLDQQRNDNNPQATMTDALSRTETAALTDVMREREFNVRMMQLTGLSALAFSADGYQETQNESFSSSILHPLFYDLRYGAGLFIEQHNQSTLSRTFGGGFDAPLQGAFTLVTSGDLSIQDHAAIMAINHTFPPSSINETWATNDMPDIQIAGWGGIYNQSGSMAGRTASSVMSAPWTARTPAGSWRAYHAPIMLFAQPVNDSGGYLVRGDHPPYVDFGAGVGGVPITENLVYTTANPFDISEVWQTHLNAQHPPTPPAEQISTTPTAAALTPRFRT